MKLIEFSIRRRVTVTMLMVAIIAFGDNLQLLPRLQVVVEPLNVIDLLAGQSQ